MLLLSQYAEETCALELLHESPAGAGYLIKDRVAEPRFADAVKRVGCGGSALDPELIKTGAVSDVLARCKSC